MEVHKQRIAPLLRRPSSGLICAQKHKLKIERAQTSTDNYRYFDPEENMDDTTSIKSFKKVVNIMNHTNRFTKSMKTSLRKKYDDDFIYDDLESFSDDDIFEDKDENEAKPDYNIRTQYKKICEHTGAIPCHTYLRQMETQTANLSNCQLGIKDVKAISISLVSNSFVTKLNMAENKLERKGLLYLSEALKDNVFITHLDLSATGMESESLMDLVHTLLKNKSLTHLNLSKNHLNKSCSEALAILIKQNDYIVYLNLSGNDIDDTAGVKIAPAIAANLAIKKLDLSWNQVRRGGAAAVVKAICHNVEIEEVDLSWNGLAEDGARAFGMYLPNNHTLRSLNLSNNRIHFLHFGFLLKGLMANDTLQEITLCSNPISSDGALALLKAFQGSEKSNLKKVDIADIPVEKSFIEAYKELQETKQLIVTHREVMYKPVKSVIRTPKLEDYDPVLLLFEYMRQENFRLIDLFRTFDTNNDQQITKNELKDGFMTINVTLTEDQTDQLLKKLDRDHSASIDLCEMKKGRQEASSIRELAKEPGRENLADMLKHMHGLLKTAREERLKEKAENRKKFQKRNSVTAIIQFKSSKRNM